eukprot:438665-Prorocentrum_minimum.AAC.1
MGNVQGLHKPFAKTCHLGCLPEVESEEDGQYLEQLNRECSGSVRSLRSSEVQAEDGTSSVVALLNRRHPGIFYTFEPPALHALCQRGNTRAPALSGHANNVRGRICSTRGFGVSGENSIFERTESDINKLVDAAEMAAMLISHPVEESPAEPASKSSVYLRIRSPGSSAHSSRCGVHPRPPLDPL